MLNQTVLFLLAAVLLVPLCTRFGLGAVLGYLIAGVAIGPAGLDVASHVDGIAHLSELGIVLLLFLIGLELQPARLWVLRRLVFGMGGAQVLVTGAVLALIAYGLGLSTKAALVAGLGLAMSSTAMVMQTLAEKGQLATRQGREAFAILLFQDLAVIPLLALMPLLSGEHVDHAQPGWQAAAKAIAIIAGAIIASRTIVRPLFRIVIKFGGRDIFTAAALLLVLGMAMLMVGVGLSASLGAFLAGVLLADSEYRHELEAAIGPFKGLLLGLFFMAVGMTTNIGLLFHEPLLVVGLAVGLIAIKALILFALRLVLKSPPATARKLAISLAQGGEFAFVLFGLATDYRIFDQYHAELLMVVVSLSMVLSPLLMLLDDKVLTPLLDREEIRPFDNIDVESHPVIIAGFGRVGQVVSRILNMRGIAFTAVDNSPQQVDFVRKFGNNIYYGDPTHLNLLYAAKVDQAKLFVLAMDDVETSIKTAILVRKHFPHVPIYARARNRFHSYKLMDLGVKMLVRETLLSSIDLGAGVLRELGLNDSEVERTVTAFRDFDSKLLLQQHAVYQDEALMIQSSKQAVDDLKTLFESAPVEQEG
ncbi:MAG: glutathione-regulated potassium-efflux system protein KefB [Verrucomicrobiaceae bacterium]|nr:glutathione-regulated potassium-efflux system protein KefB [Verrucomicrobiaceae bacterium]